jgi:ubiquinone biosynthesis protein COQ9
MASPRHIPRFLPLLTKVSRSRPYHSYNHPPPPGPFNPIESTILAAATKHIPSHGFTSTSLALGCEDAGYLAASTNLFPKGPLTLVEYHLLTQREALKKNISIIEGQEVGGGKPLGVGAKVKELTWKRLLGNEAIIHRWQEVCI